VIDEQLTRVWDEARDQIRERVNDATFRLWFERTVPVGLEDGAFVVGVPNEFARDWVESRFGDILRAAIGAVMAADSAAAPTSDPAATPHLPPPPRTWRQTR